jgi:hypothetical protein
MLPSLPQRNRRRHETNRSFLLVLKGYHRSEPRDPFKRGGPAVGSLRLMALKHALGYC